MYKNQTLVTQHERSCLSHRIDQGEAADGAVLLTSATNPTASTGPALQSRTIELFDPGGSVFLRARIADAVDFPQRLQRGAAVLGDIRELGIGENGEGFHHVLLRPLSAPVLEFEEQGEVGFIENGLVVDNAPLRGVADAGRGRLRALFYPLRGLTLPSEGSLTTRAPDNYGTKPGPARNFVSILSPLFSTNGRNSAQSPANEFLILLRWNL